MITILTLTCAALWFVVVLMTRHEMAQERRLDRLEGKYVELRQADENLRVVVYGDSGNENKS